jgi:DNA-binding MarR family transcriptional regulator
MSYANYMSPTVQAAARTDAGLASELRFSVARLTRRLRSERDPSNPLSVAALSALGVLFREGELTIGALAAHERVQPPSMTRTVNCLVEEGYVARRANDADGRQVLIDLTDQGREILLADRRRRDVWLARRLRELTPEERDLLRQAAPILQRLATTD